MSEESKTMRRRRLIPSALLVGVLFVSAAPLRAQEPVSFPSADGGTVSADVYGSGSRAVVLVPGGRYDKSSWKSEADVLAGEGYLVLAMSLRGRGDSAAGSEGPEALHLDVLAAIDYLRTRDAERIDAIGASIGGWALAEAVVTAAASEIDRVVLLAHSPIDTPEQLTGPTLFVIGREDTRGGSVLRLPEITEQYERAPEPKQLLVLEGSAHAQLLFETDQRGRLLREIIQFLRDDEPAEPDCSSPRVRY